MLFWILLVWGNLETGSQTLIEAYLLGKYFIIAYSAINGREEWEVFSLSILKAHSIVLKFAFSVTTINLMIAWVWLELACTQLSWDCVDDLVLDSLCLWFFFLRRCTNSVNFWSIVCFFWHYRQRDYWGEDCYYNMKINILFFSDYYTTYIVESNISLPSSS